MLKRIITIILAVILIFSFAGCSQSGAGQSKPAVNSTESEGTASKENMFGVSKVEFSLKTIDGANCASKDIFSANKLTMINFWGTMCIPCIEELPELEKLSEETAGMGIGVIGIVGDITPDEGREEANTIVEKKGVLYINLIPDQNMQDQFISKMPGLPVSVFVDSDGNLVGDIITGTRSKDEYKKAAEKILSTFKP